MKKRVRTGDMGNETRFKHASEVMLNKMGALGGEPTIVKVDNLLLAVAARLNIDPLFVHISVSGRNIIAKYFAGGHLEDEYGEVVISFDTPYVNSCRQLHIDVSRLLGSPVRAVSAPCDIYDVVDTTYKGAVLTGYEFLNLVCESIGAVMQVKLDMFGLTALIQRLGHEVPDYLMPNIPDIDEGT